VALWIAGVCVLAVLAVVSPAIALVLVLGVLAPYLLILGMPHQRLKVSRLPPAWVSWIIEAIEEEELELEPAIHPQPGGTRDAVFAAVAVLVVVAASIAMEQAASTFGGRHAVPEIVVGGLVLAAVTSLPNAVAAVYLARRGRGAATLSTAMNSNALNVAAGLLLPATIVGLGGGSGLTALVAVWYFALTALALVLAYAGRGLRREHGALIICAYLAFGGVLLASAYSSPAGVVLSIAISAALATVPAARMIRKHYRSTTPAMQPAGKPDGRRIDETDATDLKQSSNHNGHRPLASPNGHSAPPHPRPPSESLIVGWPIIRIWWLAFAICTAIAAADAILGHHVILIGVLILGPCCGLLTGRWIHTATVGAWAVALAVALGVPDRIWGTSTHLAFLAAVASVAIVGAASAALIERVQAIRRERIGNPVARR
jgi:hypothetical protein